MLLAVGAVTAWPRDESKFDSLRSSCGAGNPARPGCTQSDIDSVSSRQTTANVFWGLAAAAAVTTGVLFYLEGNPLPWRLWRADDRRAGKGGVLIVKITFAAVDAISRASGHQCLSRPAARSILASSGRSLKQAVLPEATAQFQRAVWKAVTRRLPQEMRA